MSCSGVLQVAMERPPTHDMPGTSPSCPGTSHPWAQIGRRQKASAVVCSAVELLAAVLFAGYSVASVLLAATVPGPVEQYYDWAAKPGFVVAVFLAVAAAGVLVWLRFGPRWPGSFTVVSVGLALALVAGGTGAVVMYERATPKASLLAAVQQMKAPVGTARDRVSYGLVPVEGALVADGPDSSERSSGAVRSWQLPLSAGCLRLDGADRPCLGRQGLRDGSTRCR